MKKQNIDWWAFWIHFTFGAIFGLLVGIWIWVNPRIGLGDSTLVRWICIIGGPIIGGLGLGIAKVKYNWDNFDSRGKNW